MSKVGLQSGGSNEEGDKKKEGTRSRGGRKDVNNSEVYRVMGVVGRKPGRNKEQGVEEEGNICKEHGRPQGGGERTSEKEGTRSKEVP